MKDYIRVGKKISYLLRHNPEDLVMDKSGYVDVISLLNKKVRCPKIKKVRNCFYLRIF